MRKRTRTLIATIYVLIIVSVLMSLPGVTGKSVAFADEVSPPIAPATVAYKDPSKTDTYFLQHQYGANQGVYSLGLGYKFEYWEPSFSIGYTPAMKSGARVVQGNIKNNWKVFDIKKPHIQGLIGASMLLNFGDKAFYTTPGKYPDKYYPPNAYFFAVQASIRHHGFFIEASIIDYFFEVAARNKHSFDYVSDLVSVGFGYTQDVSWELKDWF